jgi:cytochrome d ubiquinol oxidase subunit II
MFTAYGVWTGITLLALSILHGATFLALKTEGAVRGRARTIGVGAGVAAVVVVIVFAAWKPSALGLLAVAAVVLAALLLRAGREGWAFAASAVAMAGTVSSLFVTLFPEVLVSSTDAANSLTVAGAASGAYALKVMTVAAAIFVPLVLLYQAWTYRVFRARVRDSS